MVSADSFNARGSRIEPPLVLSFLFYNTSLFYGVSIHIAQHTAELRRKTSLSLSLSGLRISHTIQRVSHVGDVKLELDENGDGDS